MLMMLKTGWMKKWSDGTSATIQDLISVLALAPESVLNTELVRTFIDDFYDKQKKHLIFRGFIPFIIYLIGTLGFLTSTRESLRNADEDELEMRFGDFVFISTLTIGTVYFTVLEVIQMMTLKEQYLRLSNLVDITYLTINYIFIVDVFTGDMTEGTSTILATVDAVLIFVVFINWLRVFESTVIFIRLIK